jgi:heme-degrading monooxygenase HmoA
MHARMVTVPVKPERVDEVVKIWQDSVLPAAQAQPGFKGALVLGDRESGEGISISLWDSVVYMEAGESSGYCQEQLAKFGDLFSGQPTSKHFEVFLHA